MNENATEIWIQSRYRCEYCGFDLSATPQAYACGEADHLLLQAKYPRLIDKLSNYVMACKSCHKLKGQFDAGQGNPRFVELDDLSDRDRMDLIRTVQDYLKPRWVTQDVQMQHTRELLWKHGRRP